MANIFRLDDKDRKIIEILEENPKISQNEISKIVGLSQPSVGSRIKKMRDLGILSYAYGMNIKNSSLHILKVDVKCSNPGEILKLFTNCPFFLTGFIVTGNKNLSIMLVGENMATLEAIVDKHIRAKSTVYEIDAGIIVRAEKDAIIPMRIHVEKADKSPCNSDCDSCEHYKRELCLGCPITGHYKGRIWKN
ncbi:Lrp/AsnC family transcriptional regulator [Archaeoglobales archaeon]|nr:MAG: Lrp/AsnC family transcriptional regulator [Archaeoglobales archaeon]